jgi:molybdopterin biosynthesis enzyme
VRELVGFQRAHASLASEMLPGRPMSCGVVFHDMVWTPEFPRAGTAKATRALVEL